MSNGLVSVAPETLTRIFLIALYAPVCFIAYRRLIPRLSRPSARLASIFLAAQIFVIVASLEREPASSFEFWLWHLDREWNIPSSLASLQLALTGAVPIVAAWLAKNRRPSYRLYLAALGLIFLFLARDEYANLHEMAPHWERLYAGLGLLIVGGTLAVASRSPRDQWIWHGCFLAGLAMSGLGAVMFEAQRQICGSWGLINVEPCLNMFTIEEPLEFLGIWLTLVALLGQLGLIAPAPSLRLRLLLYSWPLIWLLLLFPSGAILPITQQAVSKPAAVEFEAGSRLHAYRIGGTKDFLTLHLFLSSHAWDDDAYGYSIHLVDQASGKSSANHDAFLHQQLEFLLGPGYLPIYRQWAKLVFPEDAPPNRAFWIVLTLWREDGAGYLPQPISSSDLPLLNESQVILGELALEAEPGSLPSPSLALFDNEFALESAKLPEIAHAGQPLAIEFSWRSDADGTEDYIQYLHLGHQASGEWWVYDQRPLGARLPTRLWYRGLADSETWRVPLPADLAPGRYRVYTGLYRISDKERLPASDPTGAPFVDARVPLGYILVD